jgi:hypothetical protein
VRALRRIDPLTLLGAIVALFLAQASEPWWTLTGGSTGHLLSLQVSPFYFQTNAIGLSASTPFAITLGSTTRLLSILCVIALTASGIRPTAWWRPLAITFGVCSLTELYLSFLLMHLAAEAALLGAYGVVPPFYGNSYLPVNILGLDLNTYTDPLVAARFGLPFYLGFPSLGLIGSGFVIKSLRERRKRIEQKGVQAIFTS